MSVIQIARSCELLTSIDLTGIAGLQDAALYATRCWLVCQAHIRCIARILLVDSCPNVGGLCLVGVAKTLV